MGQKGGNLGVAQSGGAVSRAAHTRRFGREGEGVAGEALSGDGFAAPPARARRRREPTQVGSGSAQSRGG